jgi:hypothetical protein
MRVAAWALQAMARATFKRSGVSLISAMFPTPREFAYVRSSPNLLVTLSIQCTTKAARSVAPTRALAEISNVRGSSPEVGGMAR